MLHTQTVDPKLLDLIVQLCATPQLQNFHLAGETAIALQLGHRLSVDIDMFTPEVFDAVVLKSALESQYMLRSNDILINGLLGEIKGIKTDFLSHQYALLQEPIVVEGIRMYHLKDLTAMKLNAIVGNGTRAKDYVDIAFLSSIFCLDDMVTFFSQKYPLSNGMMALKSLAWREDVATHVPIQFRNSNLRWEIINARITAMIAHPDKLFEPL
jgi:hypothetical protein